MSPFNESMRAACGRLDELRNYEGEPAAFWKEYLAELAALSGASWALLVSREKADAPWGMHLAVAANGNRPSDATTPPPEALRRVLPTVAEAALARPEGAVCPLDARAGAHQVLGVRLEGAGDGPELVGVFMLEDLDETEARERLSYVRLVADRAAWFQLRRSQNSGESDREAYIKILDTVTALHRQERYQGACISLCNELAGRFNADQVSLGYLINNKYMRLQSISRTAHFDRKMEVVSALEKAMEEAADQDQEILYPVPEGAFTVARVHEQLARKHGMGALLTVPLRGEKEAVAGAVCLQRAEGSFNDNEVRQIALAVQLAAPRLLELKQTDRWFPVRWAGRLRKTLGKLVGFEHTFAKVAGLLVALLLGILALGRAPYRIEAPFILKADQMTHLTAPFEGFVYDFPVRVGDAVEADTVLLYLDRSELLLEKSAAAADLQRYSREEEKNRAERKLADMQISQALAQQAQARLDQITYRLEQAVIRAPFRGVVVEGEWQDKLNAPVRPGELLIKLAQLESLYLQLDIAESDIADVSVDAQGQFAFLTAPDQKFEMSLERIHPAAVDREDGVVFEARAGLAGTPQDWWRPGMSGIAKIDVGRRSLGWIFTHRTADYLRRKLWW